MKKVLNMLILLVFLVCTLIACNSFNTIESYEENLGSNYSITSLDATEIKSVVGEYADSTPSKYEIEIVHGAYSEGTTDLMYIFQCGSASDAKNFLEDLQNNMQETYGDGLGTLEFVRNGKFVLMGTPEAIQRALGN